MIGAEHENQHRIAAQLLRCALAGVPVGRTAIEEFEEASARLSYALYFVRREIECALHSRDALTDAHSSGRHDAGPARVARAGKAAGPAMLHRPHGTRRRPGDQCDARRLRRREGARHGGEDHCRAPATLGQGVPLRREQVPHPAVRDGSRVRQDGDHAAPRSRHATDSRRSARDGVAFHDDGVVRNRAAGPGGGCAGIHRSRGPGADAGEGGRGATG
ncbi:MAG: hypothetical protein MZV49_13095 [Rhodopseudomonas palustris]|nr:hypothetical protein [Rhodopseudomonas palustris]